MPALSSDCAVGFQLLRVCSDRRVKMFLFSSPLSSPTVSSYRRRCGLDWCCLVPDSWLIREVSVLETALGKIKLPYFPVGILSSKHARRTGFIAVLLWRCS